jgi:tetratricopeptide (TPR) repeat protein
MAPRTATKRPSPKPAKPAASNPRRPMEQTMQQISRLLQENQFSSLEEANAFLQTLVGTTLQTMPPRTTTPSPSEEAQELAYDAMEARTEAEAKKLAKRALAKDPDCVDAIIVLTSIEAHSPKQAIAGLQRAVAAGERSLGDQFFKENKGHFWALLETRPYMRARQQLAEMLLEVGLVQDAIAQYQAMLDFNPNDNQGVREPLLGLYLQTNDSQRAAQLLKQYKNDISATFAWGRVLKRFLAGDLQGAEASLKAARKANRFMELFMSGQRPLPPDMPDSYTLGSEEEALISLESVAGAWMAHPQAMFWLLGQILGEPPEKPPARLSHRSKRKTVQ